MNAVSPPSPRERLASALAAAFRGFSGSSDRDLASEAIKLESKVLTLVRGTPTPRKKKGARA